MDEHLLLLLDQEEDVRKQGRSAVLRRIVEAWLSDRREQRLTDAYRKAYARDPGLGEEWEGWEEQGAWPEP